MRSWPDDCIDHCITDPPFNISKKKGLSWAFSSHVTMQEAWDRFSEDDFFRFNVDWLSEVCRVVKPNGNILVFGTYHSIYQIGFILQQILERRILNSIIWYKPNAQPNITTRTLTESTEQVVWAVNNPPGKAKNWVFNYREAKELNNGKQMRNLWQMPVTPASERVNGKHPSQKPIALVERLVQISTQEGELILDCFSGTGTLAVVAQKAGRGWVLIEKKPEYNKIARLRLQTEQGLPLDVNPKPAP
jgi:DNA modification methylase